MIMEELTITVDVRERRSDVPDQLSALGVRFSTATLAVGDYAVGDRVVERKTVPDLHRSLIDRNLWSQVAALRRDQRRAYLLVVGLLAAIPGISLDSAKALLRSHGSIAAIAPASESDLQSVSGIGPERARALIEALTAKTRETFAEASRCSI